MPTVPSSCSVWRVHLRIADDLLMRCYIAKAQRESKVKFVSQASDPFQFSGGFKTVKELSFYASVTIYEAVATHDDSALGESAVVMHIAVVPGATVIGVLIDVAGCRYEFGEGD